MERREMFQVQDVVLIGLFVALITICSFIRIPFGAIPFTLQTLGVFVTAGILGTKRGVTTVVVYILMGCVGAPVFGGVGGPGVLLGNAGGYIIGFIPASIIIGIITSNTKKSGMITRHIILTVSMLMGEIACLAVGIAQFMFITNMGVVASLNYCVVPFIIPDIIKIVVAVGLVEALRKADKKHFV